MKLIRLVILISVIYLSSCSTICHQKHVGVNIYTDIDSAMVCVNDSSKCYKTPATIDLERSRDDVVLLIQKDTLLKTITLKSNLSSTFWIGNLFSGVSVLAYAIDLTNPKRFTYPKNNYVSFTNSNSYIKNELSKTYKWLPPKKNQVNFKLAIPEGNSFYINKGYGYGNSFGFLGISAGIEYYITDLYSINSDIGVMMDFMIPFPASIHYDGNYSKSHASYLDIQVGRDLNVFHVDIGFQANRSSYYEQYLVDRYPHNVDTISFSKQQINFGLAASAYYKINNWFNLGLNYYPSIAVWNQRFFESHYSHLIMFELVFKLNAYRPK